MDAGATSFAFPDIPSNGAYFFQITVASSPTSPAQACIVNGGTGATYDTNISIRIECISGIGALGGTITGLTGSGLKLIQSNGDEIEPDAGDSEFRFQTGLLPGMRYSVGIARQPSEPAQTCIIRRGKGAMPDTEGAWNISVECVENATDGLVGTWGFETPSGGRGYLKFFPDGTYSYVARMDDPACGDNDGNGVEYGVYSFDGGPDYYPYDDFISGELSVLSAVVDTNGNCGIARMVGDVPVLLSGTLEGDGDTLRIDTGSETLTMSAAERVPNSVVGSFVPGRAKVSPVDSVSGGSGGGFIDVNRVNGAFIVFASDGSYVSVEAQDSLSDGGRAGAEWGCAMWSPVELDQTCYPGDPRYLDLNGTGGLSSWFERGHGAVNLWAYSFYLIVETPPDVGYMEGYWTDY